MSLYLQHHMKAAVCILHVMYYVSCHLGNDGESYCFLKDDFLV